MAGCSLEAKGFISYSCFPFLGFMVLGSGRTRLKSCELRPSLPGPALWRLSEGTGMKSQCWWCCWRWLVRQLILLCFWHRKHQPQSSWHKNWGQSCNLLVFFFFFFIHLSYDLWFSLGKMCNFKRIAHFYSGLLSPIFVLILWPFSIWERFCHLAYLPPAYEGVVQQAQLGVCLSLGSD